MNRIQKLLEKRLGVFYKGQVWLVTKDFDGVKVISTDGGGTKETITDSEWGKFS